MTVVAVVPGPRVVDVVARNVVGGDFAGTVGRCVVVVPTLGRGAA